MSIHLNDDVVFDGLPNGKAEQGRLFIIASRQIVSTRQTIITGWS